MFSNLITNTPFTTNAANQYFSGIIDGDTYSYDATFVSSLRALLHNRIGENESITFQVISRSFMRSRAESRGENYIYHALPSPEYNGSFEIICLSLGDDTTTDYFQEYILKNYKRVLPDMVVVDKVTEFYKSVMTCICLIDPDKKNVILVVADMNAKKFHYLQSGILAFMPWYFNPEDGVSEDEMDLIRSFQEKTSDKYTQCLEKLAACLDFESEFIKSSLNGFENFSNQRMLMSLDSNFISKISEINSMMQRLAGLIKEKEDINCRILGLKQAMSDTKECEMMEYFLKNKDKLCLVSADNGIIQFVVKDYLMWWDEDVIRKGLDNQNSYFYHPYGYRNACEKISHDDIRKLCTAVFLDREIKVRLCASYVINIGGNIYADSGENGAYTYVHDTYMRNPHIYFYSCLGGYEQAIMSFISSGNYIGAVEQCIASCESINVGEAPTMEKFIPHLYGMEHFGKNHNLDRFLELPDGSVVNGMEAVKWLNERGK